MVELNDLSWNKLVERTFFGDFFVVDINYIIFDIFYFILILFFSLRMQFYFDLRHILS